MYRTDCWLTRLRVRSDELICSSLCTDQDMLYCFSTDQDMLSEYPPGGMLGCLLLLKSPLSALDPRQHRLPCEFPSRQVWYPQIVEDTHQLTIYYRPYAILFENISYRNKARPSPQCSLSFSCIQEIGRGITEPF